MNHSIFSKLRWPRPFAGLLRINRAVAPGGDAEYSFTPRDEGGDRVSVLEVKWPFVLKFADCLSGTASYNRKWNDANVPWRQRPELGLIWFAGSSKRYALTLAGEVPTNDEAADSKVTVGLTRFFR